MSRETKYEDDRISVVGGVDTIFGEFLLIYDKDLANETPEGEGLVYDWSRAWGIRINMTGVPNNTPPMELMDIYIKQTQEK